MCFWRQAAAAFPSAGAYSTAAVPSRLGAPVVVELELDAEVLAFQKLDDGLPILRLPFRDHGNGKDEQSVCRHVWLVMGWYRPH